MRLTVIGSGTAAPSAARVNAGYLVEAGETRLLLDCGSGAVHRMAQIGIDWLSITHLALTHFHADHTTDIATLFVAWRYGAMPWRQIPVDVIGPVGTSAAIDRIDAAFGGSFRTLGYEIRVREMSVGETLALPGGVSLTTRKVPHTPESVAYSIRAGSRRIVYTGDTGPDASLGEWANGCDVLVTECSLPASMRMATHLTPEDCAELAAAARPGMLVLSHFYPPVEAVDIRAIVGERYAGPLVLATDGWTTEIEERV